MRHCWKGPKNTSAISSPCLITSGSRYYCYRWVLKDSAEFVSWAFLTAGFAITMRRSYSSRHEFGKRDTIERVWQELIRVLPRFDIAMFDKMPADICGVPNPIVGLRASPFAESGHLTNITGSWEEFAAKRLPYRRKSGSATSETSQSWSDRVHDRGNIRPISNA